MPTIEKKPTHEAVAAEIATIYLSAKKKSKRSIGKYCEEQGILASLVTIELSSHPKKQLEFVEDMKKSLIY